MTLADYYHMPKYTRCVRKVNETVVIKSLLKNIEIYLSQSPSK